MFFYTHTETEYVKKKANFWEKFYGWITGEFLRLRIENFQDIIFIWIGAYREIFKSVLVYL